MREFGFAPRRGLYTRALNANCWGTIGLKTAKFGLPAGFFFVSFSAWVTDTTLDSLLRQLLPKGHPVPLAHVLYSQQNEGPEVHPRLGPLQWIVGPDSGEDEVYRGLERVTSIADRFFAKVSTLEGISSWHQRSTPIFGVDGWEVLVASLYLLGRHEEVKTRLQDVEALRHWRQDDLGVKFHFAEKVQVLLDQVTK